MTNSIMSILKGDQGQESQILAILFICGIIALIIWGLVTLVKTLNKSSPAPAPAPTTAEENKPPTPTVAIKSSKLSSSNSGISGYTVSGYADCMFVPELNTSLGLTVSLNNLGAFVLYPSIETLTVEWYVKDIYNAIIPIASKTVAPSWTTQTPGLFSFETLIPTDTDTDIVCTGESIIMIKYKYKGNPDTHPWSEITDLSTIWTDEVKSQFLDLPVGYINQVTITPEGSKADPGLQGVSNLTYDIISKPGYSISNIPVTINNNNDPVTFKFNFENIDNIDTSEIPAETEFELVIPDEYEKMDGFVCLRDVESEKYLEIRLESTSEALGDFKLVHLINGTPNDYSYVQMVAMSSVSSDDFYYYYVTDNKNGTGTNIGFLNTIGTPDPDEAGNSLVEMIDLPDLDSETTFHPNHIYFDAATRDEITTAEANLGLDETNGALGTKQTIDEQVIDNGGHSQLYQYTVPGDDNKYTHEDFISSIVSDNLPDVQKELNKLAVDKTEVLIGKWHRNHMRLHKNNEGSGTSFDIKQGNIENEGGGGICRHLIYRINKDKTDILHPSKNIIPGSGQETT